MPQLSPLIQLSPRRCAALARQMLAEYGLKEVRLKLLRRRRNLVYQVDMPRPRRRFMLRIHHESEMPRRVGEAQLEWLAAIQRDTTLAVPAPVKLRSGQALATVPDNPT